MAAKSRRKTSTWATFYDKIVKFSRPRPVWQLGRDDRSLNATMYYVYVLLSWKDGKRYYGMTSDLDRRLREHNRGKVSSTKRRTPLEIIYYESFDGVESAREREFYFKSRNGRRFLDNKLKNGPVV